MHNHDAMTNGARPSRSGLRRLLAATILSVFANLTTASEPMLYLYPPPESGADVRMHYYWELLEAALNATTATYGAYKLSPGPNVMNAARAENSLATSREITTLVRTTSIEREELLLPIRIPLDKGLTGYRIFLIQGATQDKLNQVRTLNDLKTISIGQGAQWVDTEILRAAGLKVEPGGNYESLFLMLGAGRFDAFSRGVNEIGKEYSNGRLTNPALAIEKRLILYYPLPRYFFFARTAEGELLAKRVNEGLRLLMKTGEFDRRYLAFKKEILRGLTLSGRRLFVINNHLLPAQTPLADHDLWDNLGKELKVTIGAP